MGSLREQHQAQEATRAEGRRPAILTPTNLAIAAGVVVLAAILALVVPKLIPKSRQELYEEDRELIRKKVVLYTTGYSPTVITRMGDSGGRSTNENLGLRPTFAQTNLGTESALQEEEAPNGVITTLGIEGSNPGGSKDRGGTPSWEDVDGDGKRNPAGEKLFYHNASPEPGMDHWNTTTVTVKGTDYLIDSRDSFLNFDLMLKRKYIVKIPDSASPDNSTDGKGSYSYYVDENLEVKSMLYTRPLPETDGYQDVYP